MCMIYDSQKKNGEQCESSPKNIFYLIKLFKYNLKKLLSLLYILMEAFRMLIPFRGPS